MAKARAISGFPEWLPEQRIVELRLLDGIRRQFELFGFAPIETRAAEPLDQLLAKGETDKEIYTLRRLQGGEDEKAELGLHFDLTVPLARYVAQNLNDLKFPFKRYQIQKAWRGERPQEGRYREFTQADIDVVGRGSLSMHFDAEIPVLIHEWMFENRLIFTDKLVAMGADIVMCDPHRAIVTGPSRLRPISTTSPDIRAGMAMLIAALCAEGRSEIGDIWQIDRGYERIDERLRGLGARIERVATEPAHV